ncbi:PREDICTED: huntingtin-interacting protein M [Propithecus coquereli]|uniref:huntingtin-interacting protein M n=1 Tax=Propithecus coquereli TaxID=379532 RepID=UPI00063F152C|nr:PREDICTED: huntingtin-interacting protein M [Propithecus coquereli]
MADKRSPENSDGLSNQTQNTSSGNELQLPLSFVDRLLQGEQYEQRVTSTRTDFLLAVLDCFVDYILEMVGSEARNGTMNSNSQEGEREVDNREAHCALKDEMPGARKIG